MSGFSKSFYSCFIVVIILGKMKKALLALAIILLLVGCNSIVKDEPNRKIFRDYDKFDVSLETDSKTVNELTKAENIGKRERVEATQYLTPDKLNINKLANDLRVKAEEKGEPAIDYIIDFVQSLGYRFDKTLGFDEFPKYPEETLYEGNGDCEDTSYVLYSLLEALGYDVALILYPGHMMVAIACGETKKELCGKSYFSKDDKKYYPIETTGEEFEIGSIPSEMSELKARIIKKKGLEFRPLKCEEKEERTTETRKLKYSKRIVNKDTQLEFSLKGVVTNYEVDIRNLDDETGFFEYKLTARSNKGRTYSKDGKIVIEGGSYEKFTIQLDIAVGEELLNEEFEITPEIKTIEHVEYIKHCY